MATMVNITGTAVNDDLNYRYKMPKLVAKIEGRGNGIKTVITNMADIADALNRPPSLPTKFFGCELGAQSRWEDDSKSIVNGAHTAPDLARLLNVFIDKFVLCPGCHLPETALAVKKGLIYHKCSACGAKTPVDMSHKLCTFILKEAASAAADAAAASAAGSKKGAKKGGKAGKDGLARTASDGSVASGDAASASAASATGGAGAATAAGGAGAEADDDDGDAGSAAAATPATSAPAPVSGAARASATTSSAAAAPAGGAGRGEEEEEEDDPVAAMAESSSVEALAAALKGAGDSDITAEVRKHQVNSGRPITDGPALLLHAILQAGGFAPIALTAKSAEGHVAQVAALVAACGKLPQQRLAQSTLLAHLEGIIAAHAATLLKGTPVLLKALYDADAVEEDSVNAWFTTHGNADVRAKAKPFVEWLAEAEEEDDEGDEEEA